MANKNKTIMFFMYPEWSAYTATSMLGRQLMKSGYLVIYFGSPLFEEYVTENGFTFKSYGDNFEENRMNHHWKEVKKKSAKMPGAFKMFLLNHKIRHIVYLELLQKIEDILTGEPPDLVLLGPLMADYAAVLLKLKIPFINMNFTLISPWNSYVPPSFSRIIPGGTSSGIFARIRNLIAWYRYISVRQLADILISAILRFPPNFFLYKSPMKLAREQGGRPRRTEYFMRMEAPELYSVAEEFEFPHLPQKIKKNRCYIGASVYPQRSEEPFSWRGIDKDKPIIYCTLGSYGNIWKHRKRLYAAIIGTMARQTDWQLILQVTDQKDIQSFDPLPDNVFVEKWVPHMEVLPHVSLMICHGGLGTIREAIYFGVPMIFYASGRDNPGNAARAVYHHLGIKNDIKSVTPQSIEASIHRALNDAEMKESVKAMQTIFRQQEDCRKGVEFIQDFLSQKE